MWFNKAIEPEFSFNTYKIESQFSSCLLLHSRVTWTSWIMSTRFSGHTRKHFPHLYSILRRVYNSASLRNSYRCPTFVWAWWLTQLEWLSIATRAIEMTFTSKLPRWNGRQCQKELKSLGIVVHICNPSTQEAKAGAVNLWPPWATKHSPIYP